MKFSSVGRDVEQILHRIAAAAPISIPDDAAGTEVTQVVLRAVTSRLPWLGRHLTQVTDGELALVEVCCRLGFTYGVAVARRGVDSQLVTALRELPPDARRLAVQQFFDGVARARRSDVPLQSVPPPQHICPPK